MVWDKDPKSIGCIKGKTALVECKSCSHLRLRTRKPCSGKRQISIANHVGSGIAVTTALKYPLPYDSIIALQSRLPGIIPRKPHAFIHGHGLWNDLNTTATHLWYEQVELAITDRMHWLADSVAFYPRLFVTPSAAGATKPDQFLTRQGNGALVKFEKEIGAWASLRGLEHLGVWNLTVQNYSPDGT